MMAATKASMAALTMQRTRDGGKGWEAIAGKLLVAQAMTLDTLVAIVTERHGGLCAILNTAHFAPPEKEQLTRRQKDAEKKRIQRANKKASKHGK